jgi:outer membrane protein assembly factor BamD
MFRLPLSAAPALALALAVALAGCASPPDKTIGMSPNAIYAEARQEMESNNWEAASSLLEKLEGRAAGTPLAQQAQIDRAYVQYRSGEPVQAIATLDRFIKLHPTSVGLDYALYLKGVVNFNDDVGLFGNMARVDLSERDQKAAKESFQAFKELVSRFPESRYSEDARARMVYIVNSLSQYEVHVARYYLERGAYVAAINRAQTALSDYRETPSHEEALSILVQAYDKLNMPQLRDDSKRVLPNSTYLTSHVKSAERPWWKLW